MDLKEKLEKIQQKIKEADMVLVGIGNELNTEENTDKKVGRKTYSTIIYTSDIKNDITQQDTENGQISQEYIKEKVLKNYVNADKENGKKNPELVNPDEKIHLLSEIDYEEFYNRCLCVYKKINEKRTKNRALCNLADMLQGKNYFVISTNVDECLYQSGFKSGYVVTPCGRETLFQCSENCSDLVWENIPYIRELFLKEEKNVLLSDIVKKKRWNIFRNELEQMMPKCPNCGKIADFNRVRPERRKMYCEKGYLKNWERYMKWLSGTLNKKLLLLDLGTDFFYPQLIRWAFERTALLNQKSYLIRVHESLSNVPEELKGKAEAIPVNSRELLEL